MASNIENDYDSDTELVPDFDMVDLNDFKLIKGDEFCLLYTSDAADE